jgi:hypothetical protein
MTPGTPNGSDLLVQRLHALVQQSPDLKDVARRYEIILPLLRDADLRAATVTISPEQAYAKMAAGLPLLYDVELELDYAEVHGLMLRLAGALEKVSGNGRDTCRRIREALEEGRLKMDTLLPSIAPGDQGPVASAAKCLHLNAGFVWTLAQNALKPALHSWRRQLAPLLKESRGIRAAALSAAPVQYWASCRVTILASICAADSVARTGLSIACSVCIAETKITIHSVTSMRNPGARK